jgi:drug/metabolite transporter (DMT)-like permease
MEIRAKGYAYLIVSLLTGAMLPVVLDLATGMNTAEFLMLAYMVSIPASYGLVVAARKRDRLAAYLKDGRALALIVAIGALSYIPSEYILSYAEHYVTASLATAVYRSWPLLMLLLIPHFLKERLSKFQIVSLGLAFAGIFFALTGGTVSLQAGGQYVPIVMLLVFGAFCYGLGGILMKKYVFNVESAIFLFNLSLFVLFAAVFLLSGSPASGLSAADVFAVFYVGIAVNIVGYYGYFAALRLLKTTLATNAYFLSPFLTFVFADVILGEAIAPYYILIAALVSAGLFVQKLDRVGGSYAQRSGGARGLKIFDVTRAFVSGEERAVLSAIERGEKVLAMKVHARHRGTVMAMLEREARGNVYADLGAFGSEVREFINEIVDKGEEEMVVLISGTPAEGEAFLADLAVKLEGSPQ